MTLALTPELSEALHRMVEADMKLRRAASGGKRYDAAVEQFDAAAEKVAAAHGHGALFAGAGA